MSALGEVKQAITGGCSCGPASACGSASAGQRQSAKDALSSLIAILRSRAEDLKGRAGLLEHFRDSLPENFAEENSEAEKALLYLVTVSTRQDW